MKRLYIAIAILMFICLLSLSAFAIDTITFQLDGIDMNISIPADYVAFTRNINENDPNLSEYGFTKESLSTIFENQCIYLDAWNKDVSNEVIVTMVDSPLSNFNLLSDTSLLTLAAAFNDEYKNIGATLEKTELYQHQQAKFIKFYFYDSNNGSTVYSLQYYTVYNEKAINITMKSRAGHINTEKEQFLNNIIDSIVFGTNPITREIPEQTPSFLYTDSVTGTKFTVPENWSQEELLKERDYITAKFTSNYEEGLTILFGRTDLWTALPETEKKGLTRNSIDNSMFSEADIAEMLGVSPNDVSIVDYNGLKYYKVESLNTQSAYGMNFELTMTNLYRFENGYEYSFLFNATPTSPYYKDFEALLSSVEYPLVQKDSTSYHEYNWLVSLLIGLLVTILIHPLPLWIYRFVIIKKPVSPKKAKRIVIVDTIVVLIINILIVFAIRSNKLSLVAIFFWSELCYSFLKNGYIPTEQYAGYSQSITKDIETDSELNTVPGENEHNSIVSNVQPQAQIRFCRRCGFELPPDSLFCSRCGTEVKKEEEQ